MKKVFRSECSSPLAFWVFFRCGAAWCSFTEKHITLHNLTGNLQLNHIASHRIVGLSDNWRSAQCLIELHRTIQIGVIKKAVRLEQKYKLSATVMYN